jgi:hypothetical protein
MCRRMTDGRRIRGALELTDQERIAEGGAMGRKPLADPRARQQQLIREHAVEVGDLALAQDAEMRGLAGLVDQILEHRPREPREGMIARERVRELEAARAEMVELAVGRLLHVARDLEGREQTEGVVLVEAEAARDVGDADRDRRRPPACEKRS